MRIFDSLVFLAIGALASCVPTAARKNARIERGLDVELIAGVQVVDEGEDENGDATEGSALAHFELDLQFGAGLGENAATAFQIKIPSSIVFTSLEAYYQAPPVGNFYYGFGAELSALPGLYAVFTQYLDKNFYATFTSRVLFAESRDEKALLLNPQLSFGMDGAVDLSVFLSYAHHTGQGFDFDIDLFGPNDRKDYHRKYWLTGAAIRF